MKRSITTAFVILLGTSMMFGQATAAKPTPKSDAPKSAAETKKAAPAATAEISKTVITVDGLCSAAGTATPFAKGCKTKVSEASFDRLTNSLNPGMTPQVKRGLASRYADWLAFSADAKSMGLDKSAEYDEMLRFARMQVLTELLTRKLQKQAENVTPADMQTYYDAHKGEMEEYNLIRIIVPHTTATKDKPADEAADKAFADEVKARLAKGEDPKTLQSDAFKHSGSTVPEPPVALENKKRGSLPPTQAKVFDLKAGEVSEVFTDPSASYVYKVVSRDAPTFEKAQPEIKKAVVQDRMKSVAEKLKSQYSVTLDDQYFGGPATPQVMGGRMQMGAPAGATPAAAPTAAPAAPTAQPKAPATAPVPQTTGAEKEPK